MLTPATAAEPDHQIGDGGPTVTAATDKIRTIANSEWLRYAGAPPADAKLTTMMLATGRLGSFVACYGQAQRGDDGTVMFDDEVADKLRLDHGDNVLATLR